MTEGEKITWYTEDVLMLVIVGITGSGKTTFVKRLLTGRFVENVRPTIGLEVEIYRDKKLGEFELFDLGGQTAYRNVLWMKYVKRSEGIIFIFDS